MKRTKETLTANGIVTEEYEEPEEPEDEPANLTRDQIKTIVDEARYGKVCPTAKQYIKELDNEYGDDNKKEKSLWERIAGFFRA